jgi:hypothetical protein
MTDASYEVWFADYSKLHDALAPFTVTFDDGWHGIEPNAPEGLTRPYLALQSYGYARGWL